MTRSLSDNTLFGTEALLQIFIFHKVGSLRAVERSSYLICVPCCGIYSRCEWYPYIWGQHQYHCSAPCPSIYNSLLFDDAILRPRRGHSTNSVCGESHTRECKGQTVTQTVAICVVPLETPEIRKCYYFSETTFLVGYQEFTSGELQ